MKAQCTSYFLAEQLRDLYFEEMTGVLELSDATRTPVRLYFDRGMLAFADSSAEELQIEAHLSASGVLPVNTLEKLKRSNLSSVERAARLVSKKVLTKEAMASPVRSLVESAILRVFSWPTCTYEFTTSEPLEDFFDPDVLFTFECILKGIFVMAQFDPLKQILLRFPGRVKLSKKIFLPIHQLALRPQHGYILSRADGSMRLEEIALMLPSSEEDESLRFLYGLAVLGIIEFDPPQSEGLFSLREMMRDYYADKVREKREIESITQTAKRVGKQQPTAILGLPADFDHEQLKKAFSRAKKDFAPSRFSPRVAKEHKNELAFINCKLTEAFLDLQVGRLAQASEMGHGDAAIGEINPEKAMMRREMIKSQAQQAEEQNTKLAETYYVKAREYYHEKDYHNCIQFCRLSIRFASESAPVYLLMANALSKNPNPKWQRMAEEGFIKACQLDPWNPESRVALGEFYEANNLLHRARKQFEKALEILPSHAGAQEALARTPGQGKS